MKNKCLGVFLAFLFIPIFMITFVLFNLKTTLLNANFYKSEFRKADLYNHTAEYVPKYIGEFYKDEDIASLVGAMQSSIKPEWLQIEVEKNLDNIFNWYYNKTDNFVIDIQLAPLKGEFEKKFFEEMEKQYNALPECIGSENSIKNSSQKSNDSGIAVLPFKCRQVGKSFDEIQKEFFSQGTSEQGQSTLINEFPNEYRLEKTPQDLANLGGASFLSSSNKIFKWTFYILLGLSVLLFALIALLAKNSFRSLFRWLGIILVIPGLLLIILSAFGRIAVNYTPSITALVPVSSNVDFSPLAEIFNPLIKTISLDLSNKKLLESGIIFGVALILIIISFFFRSNQSVSSSSTTTPTSTPNNSQ